MTAPGAPSDLPPVPQPVVQALTRAAIFLVATINPGGASRAAVRSFCGDLPALLRAVGFRDIEGNLSCVMGIGSDAWDRLFGQPRPAELHPFREIKAGSRHAVATPGDLLFHIRAKRMDLCFELATQIMARLGGAVSPVDEVHGFRYFDDRDLIGFVDGTENPTGQAAIDAAYVGAEDAAFAGGSYVIVQKYLHDLAGWNALSTEAQERIIGRTKLSDIELDDAVKPTYAHNALDHDRGGWQGNQDHPRQHAVRPRGREGVRHLFHRLRAFAANDRADAGKHVRRSASRQLRSFARFQRCQDRQSVLRAISDFPGKCRGRRSGRGTFGQACRCQRQSRHRDAKGSLDIGSLKGDPAS